MRYTRKNMSRRSLGFFKDGDIVDGGNYSQVVPTTVDAAIIINDGNFVNISLPNATINGGNHCAIDYCYHLHPTWGLPEEELNCRHVVEANQISIDGVVQEDLTEYSRQDLVVAHG